MNIKIAQVMNIKVTEVSKVTTVPATLPDGIYEGVWSGFFIHVTTPDREVYELKTDRAIKGIDVHIEVEVKNGVPQINKFTL